MSGAAFTALLRKDLRLFRAPVVGLIVSCGMVYVVGTAASLWVNRDMAEPPWHRVLTGLESIGFLGMTAVALIAAAFGGMAFATERATRAADFLALLPVTRGASLASKLLASLLAVGLAFGVNFALVAISASVQLRDPPGVRSGNPEMFGALTLLWAAAVWQSFGVAFGASSLLRSAAISAAMGGASTVLVVFLISVINVEADRPLQLLYFTLTGGLGLIGAIVGGWVYVRRVEP